MSILFIGNSFSYYHCLPKLVVRFARSSGSGHLVVDGAFRGGATLKMLWHDGKAIKKLEHKNFNYVVLQERGRLGGVIEGGIVHVGKPAEFHKYVSKFNTMIRKANAETILYCPPAFLGIGLMGDAKKLHKAHVVLAKKLHIALIPAEAAFILALKMRPDINLFEHDGHHPNPLGTYLVACLFYKKLFHAKVANLPLISYLSRSEKLPTHPKTVSLSRADARFLWSVANQTKW